MCQNKEQKQNEVMNNGNDNQLSNSSSSSTSLETIPEEETELPRISELIPKSPETRQREQEFFQSYDKLLNVDKQRIDIFYEMLIVNRNLKRIGLTGQYYIVGKYTDYGNV